VADGTSGADLPDTLIADQCGDIAILRLNRARKRNAIDDVTLLGIERFFTSLPSGTRAVVIDAVGDHFSVGLDLFSLGETSTFEGIAHSQMWHRAFERIELCTVPVVAVLKGAVIGGGLELATAAHLRVAEPSTFYALPEGQRGLFVGGGASVRVSRMIGAHRMADLMLTGRTLDAEEGHRLGLSNYLVERGQGFETALDLAGKIASNSPVTNYAIIHALPRIAESDATTGYLIESLMAAIAQGSDEAKQRMRSFLDGSAAPGAPATSRTEGAAEAERRPVPTTSAAARDAAVEEG
jgi:(methylthio)acryloyl-CoA hydratase